MFDDIFSRLDTIHERDGQRDKWTDRRTDTGRQQRPRLRIASRSKNCWLYGTWWCRVKSQLKVDVWNLLTEAMWDCWRRHLSTSCWDECLTESVIIIIIIISVCDVDERWQTDTAVSQRCSDAGETWPAAAAEPRTAPTTRSHHWKIRFLVCHLLTLQDSRV